MLFMRPAVPSDCEWLAPRLREIDRRECEDLGITPLGALTTAVLISKPRCVVENATGKPIAMFGVVPLHQEGLGCAWLLATDAVHKPSYAKLFLKYFPEYLDELQEEYDTLTNKVSLENTTMIRLLLRAGATFFPAEGNSVIFARIKPCAQ